MSEAQKDYKKQSNGYFIFCMCDVLCNVENELKITTFEKSLVFQYVYTKMTISDWIYVSDRTKSLNFIRWNKFKNMCVVVA